jgi:hypothetical protein
MKIGKGNRSTLRKPVPAPLCPPQIPLYQTRDRTRAAAVWSQRLTAWSIARPYLSICHPLPTHLSTYPLTTYLPTYPPTIYLSIYLSMALQPIFDLGRFFTFFIFYTVCTTPWTGDKPVVRPLPTRRTVQTQNKRTQTSMPWMGFEPTIPVFERAMTVHVLDCAATVIWSYPHGWHWSN